jgi:sacsin
MTTDYSSPLQRSLPKNYRRQSRYAGVKVLLSNLRSTSPDQLAPFQDLWGYDLDTNYYDGTIFRMPLRKAPSPLRKDVKSFGAEMALKHLLAYTEEARISLLFLRKINVVTFQCQTSNETLWSVAKEAFPVGPDLSKSGFITCLYKNTINPDEVAVTKDEWWVYKEVDQDLESVPIHLQERLSRVRKNVECGVAALISCTNLSGPEDLSPPIPKIFSSLPLPIDSNLPVHIHATFALSGDRRSLTTGGEFAENSASEWNTWLLKDKVTKAYFNSLEGLAQRIGPEVYHFWPSEYSGKGELAPLVESFWNTLPLIDSPMYPGIQSPDGVSKVMTKSEAIFNLFPSSKSKLLDPFLKHLLPNLATSIPSPLIPRFKGMPFKSVCGGTLRGLLKTPKAREWLQKLPQAGVNRFAILNEILSEAIPINDQGNELDELVGCALIPLEDDSLGEIQLLQANNKTGCYYIADEVESNIFSFAKCLIVSKRFRDSRGLQELVKQGRFNVKALKLCHVQDLLCLRSSIPKTDNPATDAWLSKFWSYWNESRPSVEVPPIAADLFAGQPLLKSTYMGTSFYRSFDELDSLPCVIDPTDATHKVLCQGVTGIHIFRPDFMPHSTSKAEASLSNSQSFKRFINALSKLSSEASSNKADFVKQQFTDAALRVSL